MFLWSLYSVWLLSFTWGSFELMNFFSKLFLMEIDLWRAEVIPGFVLNFSLYLLTFFQWSMCIQDRVHIVPPPFSVGEAWKFSMSGKRRKLALFEFLFFWGKMNKKGEVDIFRGTWGFSESNFPLLITYQIRKKNVNYRNNHNHNVLYLLTTFQCLRLVI